MSASKYLIGLLLTVMGLMVASCVSSEEPEGDYTYYMSIQSQVNLNLDDDDENQGTMPDSKHDVLSKTILQMKRVLPMVTSE